MFNFRKYRALGASRVVLMDKYYILLYINFRFLGHKMPLAYL
jgi:hypothetical protein